MARNSAQAVETIDDIDAPIDFSDEVEVTDNIDAWMQEMLSGPAEDDLW